MAVPRKLLLAIAVAAIRTPALQTSVILMVLSLALVLQTAATPYATRSLNIVEALSLAVLWLSAFSGMVLADGSQLSDAAITAIEGLVAGVNLAFLLGTGVVVAVAFAASISISKEAAAVWLAESGLVSKDGSVGGCLSWPCRHGLRRGFIAWAVVLGVMEEQK